VIGYRSFASFALFLAFAAGASSLAAQPSLIQSFRLHNAEMASLQPPMVTPLVASDPRLIQYVRLAVSSEYTEQLTHTVNFGNGRGAGMIAFRRFEFDWLPPPYIEHHSSAADGIGDTSLCAKVRIASGNAEHGNFDLAAVLVRSFPTGSHTNGAATGAFGPTLVGAYGFRRIIGISALGGTLPTGKIAEQGRSIAWNSALQAHATRSIWFEFENNATFYRGGKHDGMEQNFLTPGAFYVLRHKDWKPTHPVFVFGAGMQIASSRFHLYNHNLIGELRILF
jgi:hypothetical protein